MPESFTSSDRGWLFLPGPPGAPVFLFIHGYGSAPQDLLPLARHINSEGYNCALLLLKGHGDDASSLCGIGYADYLDQAKAFYSYYRERFAQVYLVGFSLGATLSLDLGRQCDPVGIVAISTFLKTPTLGRSVVKVARIIGLKRIPRIVQVTRSKTKRELVYSAMLPVEEVSHLISKVSGLASAFGCVRCPVIFFHSTDDRVSDYWTTAALAGCLASRGGCLVTFRHLKHFLQFDAPSASFFQVIKEFFWPDCDGESAQDAESLRESWCHASEELRHWSGILFQLIVGFFSVFGALLYFSLGDVLERSQRAPYYLLSYSMITSFFLVLLSLYFFYVNRVNVFIKHHIEPYVSCMPWTRFRTSWSFAGKESESMTRRVTMAVVGLPLLISGSSLFYALAAYSNRMLSFHADNAVLTAGACVSMALLLAAVRSLHVLSRYTKRELYRMSPPTRRSGYLQRVLQALHASVLPGTVSQCESPPLEEWTHGEDVQNSIGPKIGRRG